MYRYLAVLLLAGCALPTASEMRESEPAALFESKRLPLQVAQCIGRNAEAWAPSLERFTAIWRPADKGAYEVAVLMRGIQVAVADAEPLGEGSRVRIWQVSPFAYSELATLMAKGC